MHRLLRPWARLSSCRDFASSAYRTSNRRVLLLYVSRPFKQQMSTALSGDARKEALASIPEWKEVEGRDAIHREYKFKDFQGAFFGFMTQVGKYADEKDHHPEWFNVYNTVKVTLATHTASGVTEKDIDLAKFMDNAAKSYSK